MKTKIHIATDSMQTIRRLAEEAVISNSIVLVKGSSGSGKSHIGAVLALMAAKDQFPFKAHLFDFFNVDDSKVILLDALEQMGHSQPISQGHIPKLARTFAKMVVEAGGGLLFFDNVDNLRERDLTSIMEAVKIARRSVRVGMLMTSSANQSEFDFLTQNPRYLAECSLKALTKTEVKRALSMIQPALENVIHLMDKGDVETVKVFDEIHRHLQGNFERIISFLASLEYTCKGGVITTDSLRATLKRRQP